MKFEVHCRKCDSRYVIPDTVEPRFCSRCGSNEIDVARPKTRSRLTAERLMSELDELREPVVEAYKRYEGLATEWENRRSVLAVYVRRGVITHEEYERYKMSTLPLGQKTPRKEYDPQFEDLCRKVDAREITVGEACVKLNISRQTWYTWRKEMK